MRIAIGSDHGGFAYKTNLISYLKENGHDVVDMGTDSIASCDYADFAIPVAHAVRDGEVERGIVICGTGIGISITANKVKGIRCALCSEPVSAALTRSHNDANMLAMGARTIGEEVMYAIVDSFLNTEFDGGRHKVRIDKIAAYENSN